jgi:hypothetical protein
VYTPNAKSSRNVFSLFVGKAGYTNRAVLLGARVMHFMETMHENIFGYFFRSKEYLVKYLEQRAK